MASLHKLDNDEKLIFVNLPLCRDITILAIPYTATFGLPNWTYRGKIAFS